MRWRSFVRDDRGASAAEFALLLLPFLALVFGMIHLFLALYSANRLSFATEATSRCMAVSATSGYAGSTCWDETKARAYFTAQYHAPTAPPVVTYTSPTCGKLVSATANYTINAIVVRPTVPLSASACYPVA